MKTREPTAYYTLISFSDYSTGTFSAEHLFCEDLFLDPYSTLNIFFHELDQRSCNNSNFISSCSHVFGGIDVLAKLRKNPQWNTHALNSVSLVKLPSSNLLAETLIKKKSQAQMFSCKFCKMFKNTFFIDQHRVTASVTSTLLKFEIQFIMYFSPTFATLNVA